MRFDEPMTGISWAIIEQMLPKPAAQFEQAVTREGMTVKDFVELESTNSALDDRLDNAFEDLATAFAEIFGLDLDVWNTEDDDWFCVWGVWQPTDLGQKFGDLIDKLGELDEEDSE